MAKAKKAKAKKVKAVKVKKVKIEKVKIKKMAKKELKKYKGLLLKEREKMVGGMTHIAETALKKSSRDASGDLSGYSYHMADMASDDYEREFSLDRATEDQKMLYAIDEALKRVQEGTYGSCQECSKAISKKRLVALPHAEVCIECQRKSDAA